MSKLEMHGKGDERVIIDSGSGDAYIFEVQSQERLEIEQLHNNSLSHLNWDNNMIKLEGYDVFPWGIKNDMPLEIRETLAKNHLAPRVLKKKKLLNWGMGPQFYRMRFEGEQLKRDYYDHNDQEVRRIKNWLKSWDYIRYLERAMTDFNYMEMFWTKVIPARSGRLSRPAVNRLEHVPVGNGRYARTEGLPDDSPATLVIVGDYQKLWNGEFRVYPIADWSNLRTISMYASGFYSFGTDHYTRPDLLGVLPWLRKSSSIPFILEALSRNSLNVKYHVKSPNQYWLQKKEELEEQYAAEGKRLTQKDWEEFQKEKYRSLTKVLAGDENVGKFFSSEVVYTYEGGQLVKHEWEIQALDQKIKDFVEAQINISKRSDFAGIAALGLHAALSNVSADGKSDSGSEQLYALQNYLMTEVHLPEQKVTDPINRAIALNFPNSNVRLGFYHNHPQREEDKTSSARAKNQTPE